MREEIQEEEARKVEAAYGNLNDVLDDFLQGSDEDM